MSRALVKALAALGVAAYGLAALVTVADVMGRKLGYPVKGVVDLVQLFVVTGAWLVMPFAFMATAHVSVDFVIMKLPRTAVVPLRFMATALGVCLVGLMLWQGYLTFLTRTMFGDTSQQLGIPVAWYWYPLLIGLSMSLLALGLELIGTLQGKNKHE
jgi:TRAP-type C4-dicarboxylate transport system permease small subunit